MTIATEKVGQRVYVTGETYAVKDRLKAAGCHWDGDRRQWWIGAAKACEIQSIVDGLAAAPAPQENLDDKPVVAKVEYRGRTYYVIGEARDRCRLAVLDGSIDFWADQSACRLIRRYEAREVWDGRRYSGRTVTRHQTLGGLRRFVEDQRAAERSGEPACQACGKRGGELVRDLEDGALKHRHCCDIAP